AMDEEEDRRQFASGAVYVQTLDLGRAIGNTLGLADTMARQFAVADSAFNQLLTVRGIGGLIVGRIEGALVIIQEYRKTFSRHQISLSSHSLSPSGVPNVVHPPTIDSKHLRRHKPRLRRCQECRRIGNIVRAPRPPYHRAL